MGVEAMQVHMTTSVARRDVVETLMTTFHGANDEPRGEFPDTVMLTVAKDACLFELMVDSNAEKGSHLSIRFSICHPSVVDDVFLALVHQLASVLDAVVRIPMNSPRGLPDSYSDLSDPRLREAVVREIAEQRRAWKMDFGTQTAAIRCDEAIRHFIMRQPK